MSIALYFHVLLCFPHGVLGNNKNYIQGSNVVPHQSTNIAQKYITFLSKKEAVLSSWYCFSYHCSTIFIKNTQQRTRISSIIFDHSMHQELLSSEMMYYVLLVILSIHPYIFSGVFCVNEQSVHMFNKCKYSQCAT